MRDPMNKAELLMRRWFGVTRIRPVDGLEVVGAANPDRLAPSKRLNVAVLVVLACLLAVWAGLGLLLSKSL